MNPRIKGSLLVVSMLTAGIFACSDDEDDDSIPDHSHGGAGGEAQYPGVPSVVDGGLAFTIDSVDVTDEGVAQVEFTITDANGKPLDLEGEVTRGAVSPSFILSWLGENEAGESTQYTAYTLRTKTSTEGEEAIQSSTDSGGEYEELELGKYRYTFGTTIEIDRQKAKLTHTLGVYATREYEGVRYVASDLMSWVPDGSDVETVLDVVVDEACNSCHTRLEFHGGARRGVQTCNLCHTEENSLNPESGNTIDFQVMIHKIHMGANLPSVQEGDPYYFVGYMNHVADYSEVEYPWDMKDCAVCHQGSQGDRWITRPSQKPCSSCHDRTYFGTGEPPEGWTKHTAGPRDDSECIVCHGEDSLEPISQSHLTTLNDPTRPQVSAEILSVSNSVPGLAPVVEMEFTVDGTPHDILAEPFDRIRMKVWGPSTDVTTNFEETISEAGACSDPIVPPCLEEEGTHFLYHATTPFPADASGSYMVGLDGRYASDSHGNVAFRNAITTVALSGELLPRRQIVSREKCNSCHGDLAAHGGSYTEPLYCLNCHNTTAYAGPEDVLPGDSVTLNSINFKDLIHRAHASVAYPAPLNDCQQCHLEGSYEVPLDFPELQPSLYARFSCPEDAIGCEEDAPSMGGGGGGPPSSVTMPFDVAPESAACVSCHSAKATWSHAETNIGQSGEACATCHGVDKGHGVDSVHALDP